MDERIIDEDERIMDEWRQTLEANEERAEVLLAKRQEESRRKVDALFNAGVPGVNRHHGTPLMQASMAGNIQAVHALLEAGADVNLVTPDGETALMCGWLAGDIAVARVLLAEGATLCGRDKCGYTAVTGVYAAIRWDMMAVILAHVGAPAWSKTELERLLPDFYKAGSLCTLVRAAEAGGRVVEHALKMAITERWLADNMLREWLALLFWKRRGNMVLFRRAARAARARR